ncbi:MAG: hypothetical protein WCT04_21500 [Planctomycetota bacterium]
MISATAYDCYRIAGGLNLANTTLNVAECHAKGNAFTLIENDATDAVVNTFAGLPEGTLFKFSSTKARITYTGGSGNDVVAVIRQPVQITLESSQNPALKDKPLMFNIGGTVSDPTTLSYTLNFGDGSPVSSGTFAQGTIVQLPHTYTSYYDAGTPVTLFVTDGIEPATTTLPQFVPAPASGADGQANILQGGDAIVTPNVVPYGGMGIHVIYSNGGVYQLSIEISNPGETIDDYDVESDITVFTADDTVTVQAGKSSRVLTTKAKQVGPKPVVQVTKPGIVKVVAKATPKAVGPVRANRNPKLAQITIPVSLKEVQNTPTPPAVDRTLKTKSLSIKVMFDNSNKNDQIKFTCNFELPQDFDEFRQHKIGFGVNGIIDLVTFNPKGNFATGGTLLKDVRLSGKPKDRKEDLGGGVGTISGTFSAPNLVEKGLKSAAIDQLADDLVKGKATMPRSLQLSMTLDGEAYNSNADALLKVSPDKKSGTVVFKKPKNKP